MRVRYLSPAQRSDLANRLRTARELAELSQVKVAEELHCSRQSVAKWEREGIVPINPRLRTGLAALYHQEERALFAELEDFRESARNLGLERPA